MKKIIIVIILILTLSGICYAQPTQLTDRELLIKLYTKIEAIEKSIYSITPKIEATDKAIVMLDKRVTTNETNFVSFCKRFDDLTIRWNTLITIFFTSLLGMIAWIVRNSYVIRKENNKVN